MFIFEGNEIETDSEGYLKDTTQWSEAMAEVIAAQEGITLAYLYRLFPKGPAKQATKIAGLPKPVKCI